MFLQGILDSSLKLLNIGKPKQNDLPLQMVRGINIWKEYRLEEEGVENVQNLATADVVELAVKTHYNFRTLIDWIDQSILLARLTDDQVKKFSAQAVALSAIDLASASPDANGGDKTMANAIAQALDVNPDLLAQTMNNLGRIALYAISGTYGRVERKHGSLLLPFTTVMRQENQTEPDDGLRHLCPWRSRAQIAHRGLDSCEPHGFNTCLAQYSEHRDIRRQACSD